MSFTVIVGGLALSIGMAGLVLALWPRQILMRPVARLVFLYNILCLPLGLGVLLDWPSVTLVAVLLLLLPLKAVLLQLSIPGKQDWSLPFYLLLFASIYMVGWLLVDITLVVIALGLVWIGLGWILSQRWVAIERLSTMARRWAVAGLALSLLASVCVIPGWYVVAVLLTTLAGGLGLGFTLIHGHDQITRPVDMLEHLDRRLNFLSRVTSDAVLLHEDGIIRDANMAARHLFGLGEHDIVGRMVIDLIDPLYHEEYQRQLTLSEPDDEAALMAIDADGNERAVQMMRPLEQDVTDQTSRDDLLVFKDIGERLSAQQSVVEQTALLLLTMEDSFHAVALFGDDGNMRFMNRLFRQWTGLPVSQYQGSLTLTGLVTLLLSQGEQAPFGADLLTLAGEDRMVMYRKTKRPTPDQCQVMAGLVVDWLMTRVGQEGEWEARDGRVYKYGFQQLPHSGMMINLFDISEIRHQETRLHQQSLVMHQQERMARLGSLLTGVSHELNNPLTIVIGQASMMRDMAKDDKTRDRASQIYDAAQRCRRIVASFLDIARRNVPEQESVNLHDLVHQVMDVIQPRIKTSQIAVKMQLAEAEAAVDVDADQFQQVIMNLLLNAVQALEPLDDGHKQIIIGSRVSVLKANCLLWIEDNGRGVSEHLREKIFEAFFTTKKSDEGTGIGLALCRDIVTAHRGTLNLAPATTAVGAKFVIELPLRLESGQKTVSTD